MNNNLKVHGALLFVGLIYGANYSIAKDIMPDLIKPFGFILVRVFAATLIFWIIHSIFVKEKIQNRRHFIRLFACAVFGVAVNQMLFFQGLNQTGTISASVIMTMSPVIVLIASYFILHEKVTKTKILGVILGGIGAILLITRQGADFSNNTFTGDLMILGNATSYSIYLVLVKPLMKIYSPLTIIKWIFLFGFLLIFPFGLSQFNEVEWSSFPARGWISVGYVIVGTTVLAYLLNAWALKYVSPTIVGYYIYLQPLFATLIALIFLDEPLSLSFIFFSMLIFTGVLLVSRKY